MLFSSLAILISGVASSPMGLSYDAAKYADERAKLFQPEGGIRSLSSTTWGGFKTLDKFDDFHGVDNFDGHNYQQVFVKDHELVCHAQEVHIVQQRLLVLHEMAKRIISEHICEVEVQTIVFEQYFGRLYGFGRDLRRVKGGHRIGFDRRIASHFDRIVSHDDTLSNDDWGFSGHDLGKETYSFNNGN
ncbi:hypothetical protein DFP72DRAFT_899211 [Ephemerocybe angulata]|uniref:Uncharacterized protein n=1 Tax=Ephemerocybe angulata TaxID=980116 RepID=A0A8H6HWG7_9AGAR|nr:hypothetical protein DFP72DRAFT_899211 [Tulosesus angulatus]